MKNIFYTLFIFSVALTSCVDIIDEPTPPISNGTPTSKIIENTDALVPNDVSATNDTTTIDLKTVFNGSYLEVYDDSLFVFANNSGILYPIYKSYITDVVSQDEYGDEIWDNITKITIEGSIDARDFNTIKWNFRKVVSIDFGNANIVYYSGDKGTNEGYDFEYNMNEIPMGAFFYWMSHFIRDFPDEVSDRGMESIEKIILPNNITTINRNAFARTYNLKEIALPDSLTTIGYVSFRHCHSIEKLYIPKSVTSIDTYAFTDMNSLKEVHIEALTPPTGNDIFGFFLDSTNYELFGYDEPPIDSGNMSIKIRMMYENTVLYVPKGCKKSYAAWASYFKEIVEE